MTETNPKRPVPATVFERDGKRFKLVEATVKCQHLEAELKELKETHADNVVRRDVEIVRLREALEKYGDHEFSCRYNPVVKTRGTCICGFDKALNPDD